MKFPFKLAKNKEFDVIGFGTNAVDYLIQVPEYPDFNSKIELDDYTQLAGGEIASTMIGLRRLDLKTAYIGHFGKDQAGDFGLQTLIDEGVNVDFATQIEGAQTQIAFIIIDGRSGERTVIWKRDEKLACLPEDVPLKIVQKTKVFHATPHDTLACARMAREAKAGGAIVSIDIDNTFDGLLEMIPLIDIFISSAEFPEKLVGIKDKKESLREIRRRFGCAVVGMTLGKTGSLILCEDKFIETKGCEVPNGCQDTTGAGDAFRVGFLYGLLTGETVEISAEMANAVAALKCREIGARTALPNTAELLDFIAKR
ncbi:sugar kinase [soil metagenome]|jgi:sugar/nucleoside kinase (ribokinase family)|nr:carbohydrate kinase family protein [Acidobacteriota bacterium]